MIAAGMLRRYMGILMKPAPKTMGVVEQRSKSTLQKCAQLKGGSGNYISTTKWEARRQYYSSRENGYLRDQADWAEEETANSPPTGGVDPANPMAMMDGMKGSMAFMVQNMVMMQGIQHFFKGFILLKVPFPLTRGFKMMFQRGLRDSMSTLDTSYVSSVSWYFLVMYGLRGFFAMVIGSPSQEELESNKIQHTLGMNTSGGSAAPSQQFDAPKVLKQEADNMELLSRSGGGSTKNNSSSSLDTVEKRLLGKKYPKKKLSTNAKGDDLFGYGTVSSSTTKSSSSNKKKK